MRRRPLALLLPLLALPPQQAQAGAWTLPPGHVQIIAGVDYSAAGAAYGHDSRPDVTLRYDKMLVQIHGEYGLTDWLTLIAAPGYAAASLAAPRRVTDIAHDFSFEGGARLRLARRVGVFSVQLTAKTAGAFDTSVSVDGAPGQQLELRLLYGTGFTLLGRHGFFDAEFGQRWIAGKRADELPADLTLGYQVTERSQILLQSFNIVAEDDAEFPYSYFRLHKVSFSTVSRLWRGIRLESSVYYVPAGQNALAEKGAGLKLWIDM